MTTPFYHILLFIIENQIFSTEREKLVQIQKTTVEHFAKMFSEFTFSFLNYKYTLTYLNNYTENLNVNTANIKTTNFIWQTFQIRMSII